MSRLTAIQVEPRKSDGESADQTFGEFELAGWQDEAKAAAYDLHLSQITRQSIDALLDDAQVRPGYRVLDVATGAGYVAAAARARGAMPIGIDFSAVQVRIAAQRYPDIRFEQADAQALPFAQHSFDAVVNAFGLCHVPNPAQALNEAFRVLRPGGRIAFSVWDTPERAIGFGAVYAAIREHGSLAVSLPVGPNFFLFSNAEQSLGALRAAGFESAIFRAVPQIWRLGEPDALYDIVRGATVRAAATLSAQSADAQQAIRAALRQVVTAHRRGAGYELPMPAVIAAAVKPA